MVSDDFPEVFTMVSSFTEVVSLSAAFTLGLYNGRSTEVMFRSTPVVLCSIRKGLSVSRSNLNHAPASYAYFYKLHLPQRTSLNVIDYNNFLK